MLRGLPPETAEERRRDHRHAARVALGLLLPGTLLLLVGRPEHLLYMVFGSFAGMYGRLEPPRERVRHQFHGGGMLVTGVAIGSVLAERHAPALVLVVAVTLFATIGSLVTDRLRLRPGGPFFGIFALGATAMVRPDLVSPVEGTVICAATAAFCLLLGLVRSVLSEGVAEVRAEPSPRRPTDLPAGAVAQAGRYALATSTAGLAGLGLGIDHANWAMAGAAVPLAVITSGEPLDIRAVLRRALHRVTGTFVGLLVTAAVLLPAPGPTMLALIAMVLLFPTELFMSRHYGLALGFFTPLILIMADLADPSDPASMLVARGVDTVIGVTAGVAAAALVKGGRPWAA